MTTTSEEQASAEAVEEQAPEVAETRPPGLLERLRLDQVDVTAMGALLLVAAFLRFFSPLMPDVFSGKPNLLSNCVTNTPINAQNQIGTLCGLAYPFQRSYAAAGQAPTPPNGQVFDEVYFGVFAHDDLKGIAYFDPEPPLSKLMIASGEWLYGFWRATFQGAHGDYADLGFNTFGWRLMSAIFGSLTVPLMYLFARKLWPNRLFAITAGTLVCFDGMFFVQSRIGMIDIFPIFLIMLSYTVFLFHLGSRTERESIVTLVLTGVALGLAVAAKWIALAALASIVFFIVMRPILRRVGLSLGQGDGAWRWGLTEGPSLPGGARSSLYTPIALLAFVAIPLVIYLASWIPFFTRGQFHNLGDLIDYQKQAYIYHATLTATHPYGSSWFSWPFLYRPVAYYYEYQGLGVDQFSHHSLVAGIIDVGNPVIWWASIPAVLSLPYFVLRHRSWPAALILVGFVTQYFPWARITRVIFLYHMFGGLIFMVLALAFVLVRMQQAGPLQIDFFGDRMLLRTRFLVPAFLALVVLVFVYLYPVWTGLPISDQSYLSGFPFGKMWLRTWI
ncbi:MAG TPA: phospholipid carrier-dependent glycosyltransferase [Candidatus Dormibacteraeota bacterium]|nr:phospholipid carrier-dependent glycosyltransferase [Candidatus Dormibacteraeota bacterium]